MRFVLRFFLVAALLAFASRARAQSVASIAIPTVADSDLFTRSHNNAGFSIPITTVNFADCEGDQQIRYVVQLSGSNVSAYQLEIWAGSQDCSALTARTGASPTCWPVVPPVANPAISTPVSIRVQDIISQVELTQKNVTYTAATETVCNTAQSSPTGAKITINFYLIDPSSHNVLGSTNVNSVLTVDTKAAPIQGDISSNVGDTALFVSVPAATDPDVKRWAIYCDPPSNGRDGADAAATDASETTVCIEAGAADASDEASDDGGEGGLDADVEASCTTTSGSSSGGTSSDESCNSAFIRPGGGTVSSATEAGTTITGGTQVIVPGVYQCATGDRLQNTITVTGLVNGQKYTVGAAAIDGAGNTGPISKVLCDDNTTPTPIEDFWTEYQKAGGGAGGGFCALERVGVPAGSAAFGGAILAAAAAFARRRRR